MDFVKNVIFSTHGAQCPSATASAGLQTGKPIPAKSFGEKIILKRRTALAALMPSVGAAYLPVGAGAEERPQADALRRPPPEGDEETWGGPAFPHENNSADPAHTLVATAVAQAVAYKLPGLNFSPYMNGQDPNLGTVISQAQIAARLAIIQPYTSVVRTFGATNGLEAIPALARAAGLDVWAGAWLSNNRAANEREMTNLIAIGRTSAAKVLIVGSEVLLRKDLPESELLSYIQRVKAASPAGTRVAYAETDDVLLAHPKVMAAVDVVMGVLYPYWYGIAIGAAVQNVRLRWDKLKAAAGGKEVVVSETGWPSAGSTRGAAVPSPANAARFFLEFTTWARINSTPYFYFGAFDEAWKYREGDIGPNWGLFTATGTLKPGMQAVFVPGGPGAAEIGWSFLPPIGSFDNLRGQVLHLQPELYAVALYIRVNGAWWTKPSANAPLAKIATDGSFTIDYTTGGVDQRATEFAAYVVRAGATVPVALGTSGLPGELATLAVASIRTVR